MPEPWWKTAVVYQIYPRSFADSNGDGIGDLEGIRARLNHLAGLGVDALWISPFYPSPMADFVYDVADYCDVDPTFGTLADFDRLLAEPHARDLRVLIDWVRDHTPDEPPVHAIVRDLRRLLDSYPGERMMVGEVYLLSTRRVARYYGQGDELHLAFNFPPLYAPWEAAAWRTQVNRVVEELDPIGAWPTWVLSNHDNPRHRTRSGGSEARARAAAVLLLTLRGTPFLYQGEELGLLDAEVGPERKVDPAGRDGARAPLPWEGWPGEGWVLAEPW